MSRGLLQTERARPEIELDRLRLPGIHGPEMLAEAGPRGVQLARLPNDAHQVTADWLGWATHFLGIVGHAGRVPPKRGIYFLWSAVLLAKIW